MIDLNKYQLTIMVGNYQDACVWDRVDFNLVGFDGFALDLILVVQAPLRAAC